MIQALDTIDINAVTAALTQILNSPLFIQAERQSRLLRYIVEESAAGRGGRINQFSIAIDVFDRGADFDPSTDSAVRVEVGRLRSKLREYYELHPDAEVIFRLPKGRYVADISVSAAAASPSQASTPPSEQATLVILPFENIGDDNSDDYFADGITDDLITDMSKLSRLKVIARKSAFIYKGQQPATDQLVSELGVTHVLEGSVRRAGRRLRINAQLLNCSTGQHVWADRFDRELKDIFELQDEVGRRIVSALSVALTASDMYRYREHGTDNLEAYDLALRASRLSWSPKDVSEASALLEKACQLDPIYASALARLAMHRWYARYCGWTLEFSGEDIISTAKRAVELDQDDSFVQSVYGFVNFWWGSIDTCNEAGDKAISLDPTNVPALERRAITLANLDRCDEADELLRQAKAVNPHEPYYYPRALLAYRRGSTADALALLEQSAGRFPAFMPTHVALASLQQMSGRHDLAHAQIEMIKTLSPNTSFDQLWSNWGNFRNFASDSFKQAFQAAWRP